VGGERVSVGERGGKVSERGASGVEGTEGQHHSHGSSREWKVDNGT